MRRSQKFSDLRHFFRYFSRTLGKRLKSETHYAACNCIHCIPPRFGDEQIFNGGYDFRFELIFKPAQKTGRRVLKFALWAVTIAHARSCQVDRAGEVHFV